MRTKATPSRQNPKYRPDPKPTDLCDCTMADKRPSWGKVTHQFPYHDADGIRLFSRFRVEITAEDHSAGPKGDKTFSYCSHYDRTDPAHVSLPYGLPRLLEGIANGAVIHLVEGESDAEAIWDKLKLYATTSHLGTRFPLEVAEHFRGALNTPARVLIWADRDHTVQKHIDAFNHDDESKRRDYPGAAAALRKFRALRKLGISCGVREVVVGKDVRDQISKGRSLDSCKRLSDKQGLAILKERCPREAASKRSVTLKLSTKDLPEGPALRRLIEAAESKGFILERIGENRYKTNCPNPDHTDSNPSFEFEQGDGKAVGYCFGCECDVEVWAAGLDLKKSDLFDKKRNAPAPDKPDGYCPDHTDSTESARHIQDEWVNEEDGAVGILAYADDTWLYSGKRWEIPTKGALRRRLHNRMDNEYTLKLMDDNGTPVWTPVRWNPNPTRLSALLEAVQAINSRDELPDMNSWVEQPDAPGPFISLENGILCLTTRRLFPHTPRFFNVFSMPVAYDENAKCPTWDWFLGDVWEDDPESIRAFDMFMGYIISGRIDLEAMFLFEGPTRGGRGTISEMIAALMGDSHEGITMNSLAGEFGLQMLINKSVAIVGDSRTALRRGEEGIVVERMLTGSGGEKLPINRKNLPPISLKLMSRFVVMTNEGVKLADPGGALAGRWTAFKMTKSYAGKEDKTLKARLMNELPGALNRAIRGLDDLNEHGKLLQPASGQSIIDDMREVESDHGSFVRAWCNTGEGHKSTRDEMRDVWKAWCQKEDINAGNPNWLKKALNLALRSMGKPEIKVKEETAEDGTRIQVWHGIAPINKPATVKPNGTYVAPKMTKVKENI